MADVVDQWEPIGPDGPLRAGVKVALRNRVIDRSLRYGERDYGINLVWDKSATIRNITLESAAADGVVRFGDAVSIHVDGGGHLDYAEREYGINLTWSASPTLQWIVAGGDTGAAVSNRALVRLINVEHGDYLVYGERDYGINLRWWADIGGYGSYPPIPMPQSFRSASGEPGQIELSGIADHLSVFHGGTDDELDWHVHVRPDPADRRALFEHLLAHGKGAKVAHFSGTVATPLVENDLDTIGCEWMVLDGYDNSTFDELFYSADVTEALRLVGSAWDHSADVGDEQNVSGASKTVSSALQGHRVLLQGPFVNDGAHGFKAEIHSLDSLAYALDENGTSIDARPGTAGWPQRSITWRIAAFTTSTFHRISGASYLKHDRRTRWFLALPSGFQRTGWTVAERLLGFTNQGLSHSGLDDRRPTAGTTYESYGVRGHSARLLRDPRDGVMKLCVDITMAAPADRWGGMFLAEYSVRPRFGHVLDVGALPDLVIASPTPG